MSEEENALYLLTRVCGGRLRRWRRRLLDGSLAAGGRVLLGGVSEAVNASKYRRVRLRIDHVERGALLLRAVDRSIGLIDRVAACFTDHRVLLI